MHKSWVKLFPSSWNFNIAWLRNYHQSITGKSNTWVCLGLIHSYGALSFLKIQNSDTGRKTCDKIESVALWIAPSLKMSVLASYLLLAYDRLQRLAICISWRFSWNAHENLSNWHVRQVLYLRLSWFMHPFGFPQALPGDLPLLLIEVQVHSSKESIPDCNVLTPLPLLALNRRDRRQFSFASPLCNNSFLLVRPILGTE